MTTSELEQAAKSIVHDFDAAWLNAYNGVSELPTKEAEQAKNRILALAESVAEEREQKFAHKAYHKIMLATDRKFPTPHPQSPMEFTRDAEIFNQVTAKWEKAVGDALASLQAGGGVEQPNKENKR